LLQVTDAARAGDPEASLPEVQLAFTTFPTQDWVATTELPNRVKAALARLELPLPDGLAPPSDPALCPALLGNSLLGAKTPNGDATREATPQ